MILKTERSSRRNDPQEETKVGKDGPPEETILKRRERSRTCCLDTGRCLHCATRLPCRTHPTSRGARRVRSRSRFDPLSHFRRRSRLLPRFVQGGCASRDGGGGLASPGGVPPRCERRARVLERVLRDGRGLPQSRGSRRGRALPQPVARRIRVPLPRDQGGGGSAEAARHHQRAPRASSASVRGRRAPSAARARQRVLESQGRPHRPRAPHPPLPGLRHHHAPPVSLRAPLRTRPRSACVGREARRRRRPRRRLRAPTLRAGPRLARAGECTLAASLASHRVLFLHYSSRTRSSRRRSSQRARCSSRCGGWRRLGPARPPRASPGTTTRPRARVIPPVHRRPTE